MQARDIMHAGVFSVRPETPVPEVMSALAARGISGAPVVGPQGDLIGMVSLTDLTGAREDCAAESVMTPWVVSFEEDEDVRELARQMLAKRIHRVIITRGGRMTGIVTSMDLLRLVADGRL